MQVFDLTNPDYYPDTLFPSRKAAAFQKGFDGNFTKQELEELKVYFKVINTTITMMRKRGYEPAITLEYAPAIIRNMVRDRIPEDEIESYTEEKFSHLLTLEGLIGGTFEHFLHYYIPFSIYFTRVILNMAMMTEDNMKEVIVGKPDYHQLLTNLFIRIPDDEDEDQVNDLSFAYFTKNLSSKASKRTVSKYAKPFCNVLALFNNNYNIKLAGILVTTAKPHFSVKDTAHATDAQRREQPRQRAFPGYADGLEHILGRLGGKAFQL